MQDTSQIEHPGPKWGGFDERAIATMEAARDEAIVLKHGHVGTEHVLLGLLRDPDSVAVEALSDLGVDVGALAERARTIAPPDPAHITDDPALTPRAKKALMLAVDEARGFKDKEVGTGHLLLGLLASGDGMAHAALTEADVTLDRARAAIQRRTAS